MIGRKSHLSTTSSSSSCSSVLSWPFDWGCFIPRTPLVWIRVWGKEFGRLLENNWVGGSSILFLILHCSSSTCIDILAFILVSSSKQFSRVDFWAESCLSKRFFRSSWAWRSSTFACIFASIDLVCSSSSSCWRCRVCSSLRRWISWVLISTTSCNKRALLLTRIKNHQLGMLLITFTFAHSTITNYFLMTFNMQHQL